MTRTNAERQKAYRDRLREATEELRRKQPTGPNLGPKTPLTPDEVEYLRPHLKRFRDQASLRTAQNMKAAAQYAAMSEAHRKQHGAHKAMHDARLKEIDEARERTRPTAGTWWIKSWQSDVGDCAVPVEITVGPRGGPTATYESGTTTRPVFSADAGRWRIHGHPLWATKAEADAEPSILDFLRGEKPRPYADKTDVELKRIRSEHHPDKGNAHADPTLYQQAVEELDRRRGTA